jgi:ABC-type Mn2+/Zn2+ transport system ATPase subunit
MPPTRIGELPRGRARRLYMARILDQEPRLSLVL